ncbi:MAG: hypothetical protein Q8R57_07235 [Bacteroidota bacterium]|nr:hypothetical protein [Bacteroidota bacterium]
MKKLIIPMLLLAMVACKKDETKTEDKDAAVAVTKENLVATWSINKFEEYTLPGDSLKTSFTLTPGSGSFTLRADNSYSTVTSFGTSNGTFSLIKLNGKDVLILNEPGDRPDSNVVTKLTKSSFIISNRDFEANRNSKDYTVGHMSK